jgi:flagellar protein FliO/FliZ
MVLVLALAALAIYGVIFFLKRLARPPQSRDPHLKLLASVPLGGDTFAAVISVGTKAWLIGGSSGGSVSLISEIEEQEALESMLLDEAQKSAETAHKIPDFRTLLYRLGGVGGNRNQHESGLNIHADSLRKHRDRLKGL